MKRVTCTIVFADGAAINATAASERPEQEVAVTFSGDVERLGSYWHNCTLPFLEFFLRARANFLGAKFHVNFDGEFPTRHHTESQHQKTLTSL
jgi:hypothetical protein